jgi:hypothetical protein
MAYKTPRSYLNKSKIFKSSHVLLIVNDSVSEWMRAGGTAHPQYSLKYIRKHLLICNSIEIESQSGQ